jgi:hypothetical protein
VRIRISRSGSWPFSDYDGHSWLSRAVARKESGINVSIKVGRDVSDCDSSEEKRAIAAPAKNESAIGPRNLAAT